MYDCRLGKTLLAVAYIRNRFEEILSAMTKMYTAFDDLQIASNDLTGKPGLTLFSVLHNEIYFLAAFLAHYRALGVQRFVILDDCSDDATPALLAAAPDVMVLHSARRFGDRVTPQDGPLAGRETRMLPVWKTLMLQKYAPGSWALCVDADEFLVLPAGLGLPDLIARLGPDGARGVTAVMLDTYPRDITSLRAEAPFDPAAEWYFDAERHLAPRPGRHFAIRYHGSRARLLHRHGMLKPRLAERVLHMAGLRALRFNTLHKIVLLKAAPGDGFLNSHWTNADARQDMLLPMMHFKFTPDLYRRTVFALQGNSYANGSAEYSQMDRLLTRMDATDASFLYSRSRRCDGFEAFRASGNAMLPFSSSSSTPAA
jgi:hypothetical protein